MDWNTIANIIVFLVLPWFLPLFGTLLLYLYKRGIAALPANQRAEAIKVVQMGVAWAEQTLGQAPGTAKRNEAIAKITAALAAEKITVSPHLLDMALEEAVHTMNMPEPPLVVSPTPAPGIEPKPIILTPPIPSQGTAPVISPVFAQPAGPPISYAPGMQHFDVTATATQPSFVPSLVPGLTSGTSTVPWIPPSSDIHWGDSQVIPAVPKP